MTDFRLYRKNQEALCAEIELPFCPRVGEKIWVEQKHANGATHYTFLVKRVMHVVETDEDYAYVQLTVHEESREEAEPEEDDSDPDHGHIPTRCEDKGVIKQATRERIVEAAMAEIRKKDKCFLQTGVAPRVEM